jgi:drug/metabolite transporter (DMT)-like permease
MYFSNRAGVNVGIITTIWSLNPLFVAIADYFIFGQPLKHYHYQGLFSILVCSVIISLSGMVNATTQAGHETGEVSKRVPTWIPVIFGIVTPIAFTVSGMLTKHLSSERVGFDISTLAFTCYLVVNVVVLIIAIPYWSSYGFSKYLFWMGLVGSIVNTLGIVCIQNAMSRGPGGPVSAIASVSCILLVIIEAIKNNRMLFWMEIIGLILGIYGSLILVIPEHIEKYCCCCIFKKRGKTQEE